MKYHYYSFSFMEMHADGRMGIASAYMGLVTPQVNPAAIKKALRAAGSHPQAVMISCSYLGEMTEAEFAQA